MWQKGAVYKKREPFGIFYHENGRQILDIGKEDQNAIEKAEMEMLSELVRLLYVGLTRAQNRCYVTCGKIGKSSATALDYILSGGAERKSGIINELIQKINDADEELLYELFKSFVAHIKDQAQFDVCEPLEPIPYIPKNDLLPERFTCRDFNKKINRDWTVTSYSAIIHGKKSVYDDLSTEFIRRDESFETSMETLTSEPRGFFAFPKGAVPGSCIHAIFETMDFQEREPETIKKLIVSHLKNYGLSDSSSGNSKTDQRIDATYEMLTRVLNAPLLKGCPDLKLKNIPLKDRLTELEFFFRLSKSTHNILSKFFGNVFQNNYPPGISGRLYFSPVEGFMHGFIDLVFLFEGKYYIIDWKTNHLGNRYDDYKRDALSENILSSCYDIQYHIYAVALHHYLETRLADYRYGAHFGGVFYLYVRGMTPDIPDNGIYFYCPEESVIKELSQMLD